MSGKKSFPYLLLILHFLTTTVATNSSAILYDVYPYIRVYKDGRVERLLGTEVVPASVDPTTGVRSKDVVITAPELLHISARLYLPKNSTSTHKLPLLVYFHGGAFFTESAFSPTYHNHLNSIVSKANVVAVSVNYRLAPEHPLPIGYQDSWHALKWVLSHSKGNGDETWLKNYVDFMRVYLGGDSAGANIAHNMAIRAGLDHEMDRTSINGMFLNCPHFWGKKRIGNEASDPKREALMESIWIHAYPNSTGFDDPLLNPAMDPNLSKLGCRRVLVYVAEKDILRDRGWYYEKALRKSKWDGVVKVVEMKGEDHDFSIVSPNSTKAKIVLRQLGSFLNRGKGSMVLPGN
ncbi:2-hydroxyisoflavanone dehydratase [Sesamum alatum]|uniref:2-hydroxyisoflavanone dehydratase n=1 Tax=Sesamum alatum TaxID=300844 RepID=A0AAE1YY28_9LAMI|nr:2-hydroxyisoflavanone dehydratase [Sesamum alatum]